MGFETCAIGGEPITGRYWRNHWGEPYCHACADGVPRCDCCSRPICARLTHGGTTYPDGRNVCGRCRVTAIDRPDQGRPVVAEVCRVLRQVGGLDLGNGDWIRLSLLDRDQMAAGSLNHDGVVPTGRAHYRRTENAGVRTTTYTMETLAGLPRHDFAEICAHELGHIYMYRAAFPELPTWLTEGLCELCAYTWLMEQGTKEANHRLRRMWENTSPHYGRGFRAAYMALRGRTLVGLFDHLRLFGQLPARL